MIAFVRFFNILNVEEGKGYDTALYKRVGNYISTQGGVDKIVINKATRIPLWKALGFASTVQGEEEGVHWEKIVTGINFPTENLPSTLFETPVRIVPSDEEPPPELDHLIAWYRKSDGAAVAKARIIFREE